MSILIKGMEMPFVCQDCFFNVRARCCALPKTKPVEFNRRRKDCPLVEVPTPHGDLIDREELLKDAGGVYTARPGEAQKIQHEINKVLFAIQDAPTVIEAEGEEENEQ